MTTNDLTSTLIKASNSLQTEDISLFFKTILDSKIFIPSRVEEHKTNVIPIIGETSHKELTYLFSKEDNMSILPIFSEEKFLKDWAEREVSVVEEEFSKMIWRIPPNTWIYLNPAQDIGKEISPYEIELLKEAPDSIEELVQLTLETENDEFEIEPPTEDLLKIVIPLIPVLEIYPELEEAYLLSIKEADSNSPKALIGIKYSKELTPEKSNYIRSEIERTALEFLNAPYTQVFIVDDLVNLNSPNHTLFLDAKPFFQKNSKKDYDR